MALLGIDKFLTGQQNLRYFSLCKRWSWRPGVALRAYYQRPGSVLKSVETSEPRITERKSNLDSNPEVPTTNPELAERISSHQHASTSTRLGAEVELSVVRHSLQITNLFSGRASSSNS